jgi:hypothetical protein
MLFRFAGPARLHIEFVKEKTKLHELSTVFRVHCALAI